MEIQKYKYSMDIPGKIDKGIPWWLRDAQSHNPGRCDGQTAFSNAALHLQRRTRGETGYPAGVEDGRVDPEKGQVK